MLFDKELFISKYVEPDKRAKVDTLILIGNGFDIWQGLDTSYASFEKYYEAHLDEVLARFHLKKRTLQDKDGNVVTDSEGSPVAYSDVELFYGDPFHPEKLPHEFWWDFETSMDKIDDQEINYFFGRDGIKDIQKCADNAQKILKELFREWVMSVNISEKIPEHEFGDNVLFVNFNYTDTLLKRFGVREINEFHIHGSADQKESIIVGHATHPELPYEPLKNFKDKPRFKGLYYIEEFLYHADKHVEDNYMKLRIFCALHGVGIEEIKKIYVLGLGFGNADLSYIKHLICETQGIVENPEDSLSDEELLYLDSMDYLGEMNLNIHYAISHRERVMKKDPISFPEYELLEEIINPYVEDPYHHMERDGQMRLEAAAVRRRFLSEQDDRNKKMRREYLRMLNKNLHAGHVSPSELLPDPDHSSTKNLPGAEWHISYYSDKDYKRINAVMKNYNCKNYTLHASIDECLSAFHKSSLQAFST